ncbi:MAG: lipopolysaccharide biosynthesis protein [Frankia sp.]|nr:lipopolysaccharide biosynthesis protein [Frankia sp.]
METDSAARSARRLAAFLARQWHLLLAAVIVCAGVGFLVAASQPTLSASTATMLLADPNEAGTGRAVVDPSRHVRGEARQVTSTPVLVAARTLLNDRLTVDELRHRVRAEAADQLDQVSVTALDATPEGAAQVANAVVAAYRDHVREQARFAAAAAVAQLDERISSLRDQLAGIDEQLAAGRDADGGAAGGGQDDPGLTAARQVLLARLLSLQSRVEEITVSAAAQGDGVRLVEDAVAPDSPAQPRPLAAAALGGLFGLLLGGAAGWWQERYRRRADRPAEPAAVLGAPLLGEVPRLPAGGEDDQVAPEAAEPGSAAGQAYRALAESVWRAMTTAGGPAPGAGTGWVVAVTSPRPGDGRSLTTFNLAAAMAGAGRRVAAADADGRGRGLTRLAGPADQPGLAELGADLPVPPAPRPVEPGGSAALAVVPAGARPAGPAPPEQLRQAFDRLREHADIVLVDTPPLLVDGDAAAIAARADAVILVVDRGSRLRVLARARQRLALVGTPVLGYVFNRSGAGQPGYGDYGYGCDYDLVDSEGPGHGAGRDRQDPQPPAAPAPRERPAATTGAGSATRERAVGLAAAAAEGDAGRARVPAGRGGTEPCGS